MPIIPALTTFTANTTAKASQVNANFSAIRTQVNSYGCFTDVAATVSAAYSFSTTITVTAGGLVVTGNSTITGNLTVTGTVTAAGLSGVASVAASSVTAGTFGSGSYGFPANVAVAGTLAAGTTTLTGSLSVSGAVSGGGGTFASVAATTGMLLGNRQVNSGGGTLTATFTGNHYKITLSSNATITLANPSTMGVYTAEVLQDATGGRTVTWTNVVWGGGAAPTGSTTANRKDVYTFFYDGANFLGGAFGLNFASTG